MSQRVPIAAEHVLHHFLGISRALAGRLDFQSMIEAVSEEIRFILPHDHLDVSLLLDDDHHLSAYETGLHTAWSDFAIHPLEIARSPIRSLLLGVEPYILSDDAMVDERFQFPGALNTPIFDARLRSRLHVPLRARGEVIGALSCSTHLAHFYTLDDVRHTQHVADLLASYLYALRQTEQAKQLAIAEAQIRAREEGLRLGVLRLTQELENERQRIGMDLHDQTLADMTRLHRRLARLQLQDSVPATELAPVAQALHESMQELRLIIDAVKPTILQLFGFVEGLEDLLLRSVRNSGLAIVTQLRDDTDGLANDLAEPQKIALFRIIQEAVNNAIKHAVPHAIIVEITATASDLCLTILDDGLGLDSASRLETGGIKNMQIRAQLLSAQVHIDKGRNGKGTCVQVCLPLPAPL
ncbi:ATP-binding protein [Pseudomonas helleri]|uniref:histidine kinase n=1 Tax=Pseudomonas helleri TaxID=1608996 RepID=A0A6A7YX50_9PSED|nr:ATP-binding protein [Pseudomonas helleri]MQT27910.1 GAF domain-containing protein [Pseudomonas helleri]MQT81388.1 GAF domain-containing protein [Pseudomonas helleri]MQU17805.1 GAF domain-containing protein [Pseudomonas helleri]MQU28413.1 GAF domain-containing protein [Pseudomonas helleri]